MNALLLAAGLGERLRPLTERVPKCLVPIDGVPLLDLWLSALEAAGIERVLINTHHLPDAVRRFVDRRRNRVDIVLSHEPVLLGSGGTLARHRDWAAAGPFLVAYADNLTNMDLGALIRFHRAGSAVASLAVYETDEPEKKGIVDVDEAWGVRHFEEKPSCPRSRWANAGIFVAEPAVAALLPEYVPADLSRDLMPRLAGRARAFPIVGYIRDIGSLADYALAQVEWPAARGAIS